MSGIPEVVALAAPALVSLTLGFKSMFLDSAVVAGSEIWGIGVAVCSGRGWYVRYGLDEGLLCGRVLKD